MKKPTGFESQKRQKIKIPNINYLVNMNGKEEVSQYPPKKVNFGNSV